MEVSGRKYSRRYLRRLQHGTRTIGEIDSIKTFARAFAQRYSGDAK